MLTAAYEAGVNRSGLADVHGNGAACAAASNVSSMGPAAIASPSPAFWQGACERGGWPELGHRSAAPP